MATYYVHPKALTLADAIDAEQSYPCESAASAHEKRTAGITFGAVTFTTADLTVTFQASVLELSEWRSRERARFSEGGYLRTPWYLRDNYPDHYAHLSVKRPGMVAYTETIERGIADRQTVTTPGRYLQKFYADTFSAEEIKRYIGECGAEHLELKIANDPSEIERIYTAPGAPHSCMAHARHNFLSHCHPVRVYGGPKSDLALAYYGSLDTRIHARAIVWPDRQIHGRVYGNQGVMNALLSAAGYCKGELDGARVRAIEDNNGNGYVMPYVDGIDYAKLSRDGECFILGDGDVDCQQSEGVTDSNGGHQEDTFVCDVCNDRFDESDYGGDGECNDCWQEHHTICDRCSGTFDTNNHCMTATADSSAHWCERCVDRTSQTCVIEDCETVWSDDIAFTQEDQADRTADHVAELCRECAERLRHCHACEEFTDRNDPVCEECGEERRDRCNHTMDLLSAEITATDTSALHDPDTTITTIDGRPADSRSQVDGRFSLEVKNSVGADWSQCMFGFLNSPARNNDHMVVFDHMQALQRSNPHAQYRILDHHFSPRTTIAETIAEERSCTL